MSMERDNYMIRSLLMKFRDEFSPGQDEVRPNSEKEDYHFYLLIDAGFIEATRVTNYGEELPFYDNLKITTVGHDFLEAAENETVWNKTKSFLKGKGMEISSIPLDLLIASLKNQMKEHLGIS